MPKVVGFDESAKRRKTCRSCAAIVEYIENDIRKYHGTDYGGGPDGLRWIKCPNCSKRIVLESW